MAMAVSLVVPQDIMEDILSRLSFKSLQRLRCLSKSCNCLISTDRSFARMHTQRAEQSPKSSSQKILLFSGSCDPVYSLDYENNSFANEAAISRLEFPVERPDHPSLRVVGSCHGLLLLAIDQNDKDKYLRDFCLWNPATGEYNMLPDPYCLLEIHEGFDCSFTYGFGYDSFSDDYKVLFGLLWSAELGSCISKIIYEETAAIFYLRENSWRIIPEHLPYYEKFVRPCPDYGCFADGFLNWPNSNPPKIVAFDLKTEKFLELPLPDTDTPYVCSGLGFLQGRLRLSVVYLSFLVELWVMNEYGVGQSWTRLLNTLLESKCWYHFPFCISKDNQSFLASEENRLTRIDGSRKE